MNRFKLHEQLDEKLVCSHV